MSWTLRAFPRKTQKLFSLVRVLLQFESQAVQQVFFFSCPLARCATNCNERPNNACYSKRGTQCQALFLIVIT